MKKLTILFAAAAAFALAGCNDDATIASENLSKAADNFEIPRRIVFYNSLTDTYIMEVQGFCSIFTDHGDARVYTGQKSFDVPTRNPQLEVTCDTADGAEKHFFGLADNTPYFVEQLHPAQVSKNHFRVIWKPQQIIPDIDLRGGTDDLPTSQ